MPISKPHSSLGAKNTGSCSKLANYLDKENRELESIIGNQNDLKQVIQFASRRQDFFNDSGDGFSPIDVIQTIDTNIKKLGENDKKYFAPTISFSQAELDHIISLASKRDNIFDVWQLNTVEYNKYNELLKAYVKKVMDNYAKNFNRDYKGLNTGADLVYFAKIEHFRKFKGIDKEVKSGLYKSGDYKPGLNSHAHIIVSRKDKTQLLKIDPTVKERHTKRFIGGNPYTIGFDRMKWTYENEKTFDELFNYKRLEIQKSKNQNILKNGSPQEQDELIKKINKEKVLIERLTKREISNFKKELGR